MVIQSFSQKTLLKSSFASVIFGIRKLFNLNWICSLEEGFIQKIRQRSSVLVLGDIIDSILFLPAILHHDDLKNIG